MKTWSIVLLVLAGLALIGTASAAGVIVKINPVQAGAGTSVTIPVLVSGASSLGAMDLTMTYDPTVLKFSKVETGDLSTNGLAEGKELQPGTAKVSFADTNGISSDGTLLKVTFDVIGTSGASTNLGLSGRAYGLDLKDMPTTAQGATISVGQAKGSPMDPGIAIGAVAIIGLLVVMRKKRK
jgi:hypothetical protein